MERIKDASFRRREIGATVLLATVEFRTHTNTWATSDRTTRGIPNIFISLIVRLEYVLGIIYIAEFS